MSQFQVAVYFIAILSGVGSFSIFTYLYVRTRDGLIAKYLVFLASYSSLIAVITVYVYAIANRLMRIADFGDLLVFSRAYFSVFVFFFGILVFSTPLFIHEFIEYPMSARRRLLYVFFSALCVPLLLCMWIFPPSYATFVLFLFYFIVFLLATSFVLATVLKKLPHIGNPFLRRSLLAIALYTALCVISMTIEGSFVVSRYLKSFPSGFFGYYSTAIFYILWNILSLLFFRGHLSFRAYANAAEVSAEFIALYGITEREAEIITKILEGRSNKEIASAFGISLNTARNHIYNVFQKAAVNSRMELVRKLRTM